MQTTTKRPEHFTILDNGDLCDMRKDGSPILRRRYRYHPRKIDTIAELKATLRAGPFAWPGLYPLYFVMADGSVMSFEGVRENLREVMEAINDQVLADWQVVACVVNYERTDLICSYSGDPIECAYGDD